MPDNSLLILEAARTILQTSVVGSPFIDREIAVQVPYTNNSAANAFTVYDQPIADTNGALLASVSVACDSVFQTNFYWSFFIDGCTGPSGKNFEPFDPTVNTFEAVPQAKFFLLNQGAHIQIKAYNNNANNTSNGQFSVYIVAARLSDSEASVLRQYRNILNQLATPSSPTASVSGTASTSTASADVFPTEPFGSTTSAVI